MGSGRNALVSVTGIVVGVGLLVLGVLFSVGLLNFPGTSPAQVASVASGNLLPADASRPNVVAVSGAWKIEVVVDGSKDSFLTVANYPDDPQLRPKIDFGKEVLDLVQNATSDGVPTLVARLSLKSAQILRVTGSAHVTLTILGQPTIAIETGDIGSVVSSAETNLASLELRLHDSSSIDVTQFAAKNIRIEADGTSNVSFRQSGALVSGSASSLVTVSGTGVPKASTLEKIELAPQKKEK